jgi:hypothetical protein
VKNFITLALLCISIVGFAQQEKKVEKNDQKIDELNKRLDNLVGSSKTITGDSIEFKIDLLFQEIRSIKTEIQSMRQTVEDIKAIGVSNSNTTKLDKLNSKLDDLENGEYYVVVASERTKARADKYLARYELTQKLRVVQNSKGSWYHVIIDRALNIRTAIETTENVRQKDVKDAWWVTGRKLKDI